MPNLLAVGLILMQASTASIPAVDVPAADVVAGTIHSEVTEVYSILEGSGTLVTGGRLIDPRPRENTARRRAVSGLGSRAQVSKVGRHGWWPRVMSS